MNATESLLVSLKARRRKAENFTLNTDMHIEVELLSSQIESLEKSLAEVEAVSPEKQPWVSGQEIIDSFKKDESVLEDLDKELVDSLQWAADELQSWLSDQGDYGTEGYDEELPKIRSLIARAKRVYLVDIDTSKWEQK